MKTTLKRLNTAALLGMMLSVSVAANAESKLDGSSNMICATFSITACVDGISCVDGEARTFDMPEFMWVDFKKKSIRADYDSEKTADSPFKHFQSTDNQLIIQGVRSVAHLGNQTALAAHSFDVGVVGALGGDEGLGSKEVENLCLFSVARIQL